MKLKLGKPCRKAGHHRGDGQAWRLEHNGVCLECHRERNRERAQRPDVQAKNVVAVRKYRAADPARALKATSEWHKRKLEADPYYRLVQALRSRLRRALGAGYKKDRTNGIDYEAIAKHLGPKPGPDYHVDHIIPLNQFDLSDWNQVLQACAPENHRWLKADRNVRRPKDGRDAGPVQTALPLGLKKAA